MPDTITPTTFTAGQEVAWTSTIPGLGIEIETTAVITCVTDDRKVGEVLVILPWAQKLPLVAYSNANVSDPGSVALEDLRLTGRTFDQETLTKIIRNSANY